MSDEKIIPDYAQPRLNLRPRFRPAWWAIASIVPLVGVAYAFWLPDPLRDAIAVVFLAGLVALVVYLLSGRRSFAANLAFAVLVGSLTIVFAVAAWLTSSLHAASIVSNAEVNFARHMRQTNEAQSAYFQAGAFNFTGLDRPGELDRRILLLGEFRTQMKAALEAGDNAAVDLANQMQASHVLAWHRTRAIEKFDRDIHWSYYAAAMHVTLAFYDTSADLFTFLHDHKSEWSIPPGSNNIIFRSQAGRDRMAGLRQAIEKAAADVQGTPLVSKKRAATTTRSTTHSTTQSNNSAQPASASRA